MSATVSIAQVDVYGIDGGYDTTVYEVRVDDGNWEQDLRLESAAELVTLRNTLATYIHDNDLEQYAHES